tara:strand:- start:140 stop:331 length:192 start_codon:yes stop_codon:yes gene_type:complete
MKKLYLTIFFFFISSGNAYAYLDPGTGSIILSAIIAGLVTIKTYWNILTEKIKKIFNKKKKEN